MEPAKRIKTFQASHWQRLRSTRQPSAPADSPDCSLGGMKTTPSSSKSSRCTSGPPNANPGASDPSRNTTRWHGITPGSGLECNANPTNRADRGAPASAATCPYVATLPSGIRRTTSYTLCENDSAIASAYLRIPDSNALVVLNTTASGHYELFAFVLRMRGLGFARHDNAPQRSKRSSTLLSFQAKLNSPVIPSEAQRSRGISSTQHPAN